MQSNLSWQPAILWTWGEPSLWDHLWLDVSQTFYILTSQFTKMTICLNHPHKLWLHHVQDVPTGPIVEGEREDFALVNNEQGLADADGQQVLWIRLSYCCSLENSSSKSFASGGGGGGCGKWGGSDSGHSWKSGEWKWNIPHSLFQNVNICLQAQAHCEFRPFQLTKLERPNKKSLKRWKAKTRLLMWTNPSKR